MRKWIRGVICSSLISIRWWQSGKVSNRSSVSRHSTSGLCQGSRFTLGWTWPDNWHNIGGYCIWSPIIRLFVSSVGLFCIYFLIDPPCQTVNETPLLSFYLLKNWQSHKAKSISPWLRFIFLERGEKFRRFVFLQYFGNLMINVLSWGEGEATAQLREYISSLWWPWLALFSN